MHAVYENISGVGASTAVYTALPQGIADCTVWRHPQPKGAQEIEAVPSAADFEAKVVQRLLDERVCQAVFYKVKLLGPGTLTGAWLLLHMALMNTLLALCQCMNASCCAA